MKPLMNRDYTRLEHERRFLVAPSRVPPIVDGEQTLIEDIYIDGTRMRLRRLTRSPDGSRGFKLTKKLAGDSRAAPMVSIYLEQHEYETLARSLVGAPLAKRRHYDTRDGFRFCIDVFEGALTGLVICEIETETRAELDSIRAPDYVVGEVTDDEFFRGGALCRASARELREQLTRRGVVLDV